MDAETGMRDERSLELREQIHQTQTDLGLKIGALEGEVRAVATQARDAVRDRLNAVRDVVDVRHVVVRRPVASCIVAFGVGVLVGRRIGAARRSGAQENFDVVLPPRGGLRSAVAPELAAFRALIVGKALGAVGDILRSRLKGSQAEPFEGR
jgi:hypothetical protein